jgi:thiol:disulfide interchange protein DsbD
MIRRTLALLPLFLAAPFFVLAQTPKGAGEVRARALLSLDKLAPGTRFQIAVVVDLAPGWHVNANPARPPEMIPTTVTWPAPETVVIEQMSYPRGSETKVEWSDQPVALYTGQTVILVKARVRDDTPPGPLTITGNLRYQACNDQVCLPPATIPLKIDTEVVTDPKSAKPAHAEVFGNAEPIVAQSERTPRSQEAGNAFENMVRHQGWLPTLLVVFLWGLALNLTPCVYPMIAITVSYFGSFGQSDSRKAWIPALVYCAGIIITYSTLGVAAALTGTLFGVMLGHPVVLVSVAVVLIAMSLGMFGVYQLRPPQWLVQRASTLSSRVGYLGVFLLGATVGVVAAPCVGPTLIVLLTFVSQSAKPAVGWWVFFTLSCGLALPYLVLATYGGLLRKLPKSGSWMLWVERAFGVVMILAAVWFLRPLLPRIGLETSSPIAWQKFSPELLTNPDKPVLIDFYADWCIPCKEMDTETYSDPHVVEKSKLLLMLKADLTRTGSPDVDKLMKDFRILGVPTTVFIAPGGHEREDLRQIGFVPADIFVKLMDQTLATAPTNTPANPPASSPAVDVPPQLLHPF